MTLVEVPVGQRAPLIRAFLDTSPEARRRVPVDRTAPLREIDAVADQVQIVRVDVRRQPSDQRRTPSGLGKGGPGWAVSYQVPSVEATRTW